MELWFFGEDISAQCNLLFTLPQKEVLQLAKFLVHHVADAVFLVDLDTRFLYVNNAACCMTGYSREELLSMSMYDVNPDFSIEVWLKHWTTIKQQGSLTFESLHWTKEGRSFPVEITLTYLEYDDKDCGCIKVREITNCLQAEACLQEDNEAFLSGMQERIAQLKEANKQLYHKSREIRQALKQEKELSEHRARFVSMVSHEFRNPLHIISFSTSLLKRHNHQWTEEKKQLYLERIQTAVEHLSQLMDEVFSYR